MSSTSDHDRHLSDVILIGAFPENSTLNEGEAQAAVYGLARALQARDDVASLYVFALPQSPASASAAVSGECDGIRATWLHNSGRFASGLRHLPLILRSIRQSGAPIVHVHGTGLLQLAVLVCAKRNQWRCVWTPHGLTAQQTLDDYSLSPTLINLFRHLFYKQVEKLCLKAAPAIIADSPYMAQLLARPQRTHIVPQGMFTAHFLNAPGQPSTGPVIVSIGALTPRKGHHLTLEAFAQLKQRLPDARLVIAGMLPATKYYRQLVTLAEKLGVTDSITFALNPARAQILQSLADARIFALHSMEELQNMAICEALAAGLPVVATRVGGIPSIVEDGHNGVLSSYGNITQFRDNMLALLTDNALHARMSTAAKSSCLRFDWKNIADEVMKVYSGLKPERTKMP